MKVERLTLRNFRNIEESTLEPDRRLNFLLGANGQGKTSFIEALGLLSTLRSFRGSKTAEVIRWGTESAEISCVTSPDDDALRDWNTTLKLSFQLTDAASQKATKVAFINEKPYRSSTQYLSQRFGAYELGFHTVIFNPSDHDLVRGDPGTRRSYLDRVLAAEDVDYLKSIQKYQRVLEQRNAVLKNAEQPNALTRELLMGFTQPLIQYGAFITQRRLEWLQRVRMRLGETMKTIAPDQRDLRAIYLSNWAPEIDDLSLLNKNLGDVHFAGHGIVPSLELLEQAFWQKLSSLESAEWRSGHSLVGPHRDDWAFFLGDQVLKGHGSQGEVRSALLALKLTEIELFQDATGHRPLFLLDDFSSELDRSRRSYLLQFLSESSLQVFVTTTDESAVVGKRFWVSGGKIQPEEISTSR